MLLARKVGLSSPWFAVPTAFVLLGLIDLLRPRLAPRLPAAVREIRNWERRGTVHRRLGVTSFGHLLRTTPLRYLNRRVYLSEFAGNQENVRREVECAEAAHFWAAVITVPYLAAAAACGWWASFASLLGFNLLVNLHPILHLRRARARISRVIEHRGARGRGTRRQPERDRSCLP